MCKIRPAVNVGKTGFYTKLNVWGSLGLNFDYDGGPIIENGGPIFLYRVFSQHFGNMTRPLELGIFASFYTKLGKNTPYNKNKNIKYFVYSTSYSSLTHKQILKSDLQSDLPFVVGAQKNPLIKMVLLSTHNICFD